MKNIFLIDGASGTGKSDLLEYVKRVNNKTDFLIKATTRKIRDYEKRKKLELDLRFYSKQRFNFLQLDYQYEYKDHFYGFSKKELNKLIQRCDNVFVIVRNIPLMKRLELDYHDCNLIKVFVHTDLSKIEARLISQDYNKEQIEFRLSRIEETHKDYVHNSAFFDEVIINNSDKKAYHHEIDNLIEKYNS